MGSIDVIRGVEEIVRMLIVQIEEREQRQFGEGNDLDTTGMGMGLLLGAQNVWSYGLKEKGSTSILFSVFATSKGQPLDWAVLESELRKNNPNPEPPEDSGWLIIAGHSDGSSNISWGGDESYLDILEKLAHSISQPLVPQATGLHKPDSVEAKSPIQDKRKRKKGCAFDEQGQIKLIREYFEDRRLGLVVDTDSDEDSNERRQNLTEWCHSKFTSRSSFYRYRKNHPDIVSKTE